MQLIYFQSDSAVFITKAFYVCTPDEGNQKCKDIYYQVQDNLVIIGIVTFLFSWFGFLSNTFAYSEIYDMEYYKNTWSLWLMVHYLTMALLIPTVFFIPVSFFIYLTIQDMKVYALTFARVIPLD